MVRFTPLAISSFADVLVTASKPSVLPSIDNSLDIFIEDLLDKYHVPGLSLAIVEGSGFETKGYGFSNLPQTKATNRTLWFAGSTTKAFTAAAAGKLVLNDEYPSVAWSTPLRDLLPEFALERQLETEHVTIEDVLSHRSGLPSHDKAYGWNNASIGEITKSLKYMPLSSDLRTRWQYCNIMYAVIGEIVSKVTRKTLQDIFQEWFWEPLGMRSTTLLLQDSGLARGYYWQGQHYVPEPYINLSTIAGAGAIISSVDDYALWIRAILAGSKGLNDSSPLNYGLYRSLTLPRSILPLDDPLDVDSTYALGWIREMIGPYLALTHTGRLRGFGTEVFILPSEGWGLVTMANTEYTGGQAGELIFRELLRRRYGDAVSSRLQDRRHFYPSHNHHYKSRGEIRSEEVALPCRSSEWKGVYSHRAYGNITISTKNVNSTPVDMFQCAESEPRGRGLLPSTPTECDEIQSCTLILEPSPRMWPFTVVLNQISHGVFDGHFHWIHGIDPLAPVNRSDCDALRVSSNTLRSLECRNELVWGEFDKGRAVFEYGLAGESDRLGIEMESEMVRQALDDGGEANWRAGMIWFEKI